MAAALTQLAALSGHGARVWHVSWRPDGRVLASCGSDKTIRIWAPAATGHDQQAQGQWRCTAILEDAHARTIRCVEWSPDGRYLASVSFDATAVIWEQQDASYEVVATLEGHESELKSIAWSPSGKYIATCSRDKSVWIWDADVDNDFECVSVLHGHTQDVKCVIWHPTEDLLFSASYDDTIRVWAENEDDWYCKETLKGHSSTVWSIALNPSGDQLASVSDDKNLIVWQHASRTSDVEMDGSKEDWKRATTVSGHHERTIFSVDWSLQHDLIVTGSGDDAIRVFQPRHATKDDSGVDLVHTQANAHTSDINCVRWSPHSAQHPSHSLLLASAGDDELVRIWEFQFV